MRRLTLGVFSFLAIFSAGVRPALADEPTIRATLDPASCRVGEQVLLSVTISGDTNALSEPTLPDLTKDFNVGSSGSSRNMSLVNGRMSMSLTMQYALAPRREGALVIPPIRAKVGDKTLATEPLTLHVTRGAAPPAPPPGTPEESGATSGTEDIFVRATVDKTDPVAYEQVTYRVRLYTRVRLLESPGFTSPTTQGFWKETLPAVEPKTVQVGDGRYQMMEVAFAVFPTAPGKLTIGESVLQCTVERPRRRNDNDPFRNFFDRFEGSQITLRTEPIVLDVKPLPPGAPPGFAGAVGDFFLNVTVDRTEIAQDESVTLLLKVHGHGNLGTLGDLALPAMPEFRTYPSSMNREDKAVGQVFGGAMTQQFVLVPLRAGRHVIPPVEIVTYSPSEREYTTIRSEPIPLLVSAANDPGAVEPEGGRRDIEEIGRDIRFIETEVPALSAGGGSWKTARLWFALLPVPAAAYGGLWILERRRRKLGSDVALWRRSHAARVARRTLDRAHTDDPAVAAGALRAYLADRYNLPVAGLTTDLVAERVAAEGEDAEPLTRFLTDCDAARFAPGGAQARGDWIAPARAWIDRLEKRA